MSDRVAPERRDRIFHTFRRWPLVPTGDLVKLRQSLRQVQDLGGPAAAAELLVLVEYELQRRTHTVPGEHSSGPNPGPN